MDKLKPCPFCCGTNLEVVDMYEEWSDGWDDYSDRYWFVRCNSCDIWAGKFEEEARAIEAWNRRKEL